MPTLLNLCDVPIPGTVEGVSFGQLAGGCGNVEREDTLFAGYAPFSDWRPGNGGRAYRGVRTERNTYARTKDAPWPLSDNEADPWQTRNFAGLPEFA